jgi:hypothetical protein
MREKVTNSGKIKIMRLPQLANNGAWGAGQRSSRHHING